MFFNTVKNATVSTVCCSLFLIKETKKLSRFLKISLRNKNTNNSNVKFVIVLSTVTE